MSTIRLLQIYQHFVLNLEMQPVDNMGITFKNEAHRRCFEVLAQREMELSIYLDGPTMTTLGIRDSVIYMLNHIGWENFVVRRRYNTYYRLTLKFISSFFYDPNRGLGFNRGLNTFRLFGNNYRFTHLEIANLLGFPSGPDVFTEAQEDVFMELELNFFWGSIAGNHHPEPISMYSSSIHNPAIRYFHKILAHILFGKRRTSPLYPEMNYLLYFVLSSLDLLMLPPSC